ncbi:MAG: hypothetical protein JWM80_4989 [Cyanobacteria bacterium RYN_339]|nr:hypothetical protein [Cyanobacteria bacterium RYN_339]
MTDVPALIARLQDELELAGPAALSSNVADHYDRGVGALMRSGDLQVLPELLKLARDPRPVRRELPPYLPLDGGYGKTFGPVTVGEKARFALSKLLPAPLLREALAQGPTWFEANKLKLQWDEKARQFRPRAARKAP